MSTENHSAEAMAALISIHTGVYPSVIANMLGGRQFHTSFKKWVEDNNCCLLKAHIVGEAEILTHVSNYIIDCVVIPAIEEVVEGYPYSVWTSKSKGDRIDLVKWALHDVYTDYSELKECLNSAIEVNHFKGCDILVQFPNARRLYASNPALSLL